jgi:hypothetical protein
MHASEPYNEDPKEVLILESKVQTIAYKIYAAFSDNYDEIIIRVASNIALPENHPAKVFNFTTRIPARKITYDAATLMANLLFQYMCCISYKNVAVANYKGKEAKYTLADPLVEGGE